MSAADEWLKSYAQNFPHYADAAVEVQRLISDALAGQALGVHSITARSKDPDSLAEKVRAKPYEDPEVQITDVIGVRVITLTDSSVEAVARRITSMFRVDEANSVNKTAQLGFNEVGYRSQHLVLLPLKSGLGEVREALQNTRIEVQVRSILSHAWAELEHSLRYKFGDALRPELSRRFTTAAGALELVDREFSAIESEIQHEIGDLSDSIRLGVHDESILTTLTLLGTLAAERSDAAPLGPAKLKLQYEDAFRFVKLLRSVEIRTVGDLRTHLRSNKVLGIVQSFAQKADSDPDACSALVVLGAVIGSLDYPSFRSVGAFGDDRLVMSVLEGTAEE